MKEHLTHQQRDTALLLGGAALFALSPFLLSALLVAASFLSGWSLPLGSVDLRPEQAAGLAVAVAALLSRRLAAAPLLPSWLVAAWLAAGVAGAAGEPAAGRALAHLLRLAVTVAPVVLLPMLLGSGPDRRRSPGPVERAWDLWLLLVAAEAATALAALASHHFTGSSWGITRQDVLGYVHPHGTLLEPNLLGAFSAAAAPAFALRALSRSLPPGRRWLAAAGLALTVGATAASLTRAAWVILPLAVVISLLVAPAGRALRRLRFARLAAAGLLLAALAVPVAAWRPDAFLTDARTGLAGKIGSLGRMGDDPNVRVRLRTYETAFRIWRESPWLGAGHGAMERIAAVEDRTLAWAGNLEVHALVDTGLLGTAALLGVVALALARLAAFAFRPGCGAEARRRGVERLAALGALLACAQATETTWLAGFWVLLGLAFAAPSGDGREEGAPAGGPLRILFVHPSDELYGSDRVLLDLLRRLDRSRFAPQVLLSTDIPYAGRLSRRIEAEGIVVHRMRIGVIRRRILSAIRFPRWVWDLVASTLSIGRLVRRERIDLVHANTVTVLPAALAARLTGRRLVWHIHEIVPERPGRALLQAMVLGLAHRAVTVSEAARASLDPSGQAGVDVVPNGVDAVPGPAAPFPPVPTILFVGRLSRRKGPHLLLEAFARIRPRHPSARLVFAGDEFGGGGEIGRELAARTRELGLDAAVELRPFREGVEPLYDEASLVASPSLLPESFGLVILEAMAAGRPVVASDLGGPREVVVHEETGLLVPAGDARALAEAIDRILSDPLLALRFGGAAARRARTLFPTEATARRFEAIYEAEERCAAALRDLR